MKKLTAKEVNALTFDCSRCSKRFDHNKEFHYCSSGTIDTKVLLWHEAREVLLFTAVAFSLKIASEAALNAAIARATKALGKEGLDADFARWEKALNKVRKRK